MNKIVQKITVSRLCFFGILIVAVLARIVGLAEYPQGVNQDEAYAAYNAYNLMMAGFDDKGYHFPVYFVAWGSGMSVLYSYLAIPFFKLFGVSIGVFRLPQAVIGVCAVLAMYTIGKELFSERKGLLLALLLAVNPWHIMSCRYGLDANLAPSMMLIAVCFLVLAYRRNWKYLFPAAFCFGLTLYCYALSWLVVPLFLCLFWVSNRYYRLPVKKLVLPVVLLFGLALPLLLFVGVNMGLLAEIKTDWISIPRLTLFRSGELNIRNVFGSLVKTLEVILKQYDGVAFSSSEAVGAYYYFTIPFFLIGFVKNCKEWISQSVHKRDALAAVFTIWFLCAFFVCGLNESITFIHINLVHIPMIFYSGYGMWTVAEIVGNKLVMPLCMAFLLFSFVYFLYDYSNAPSAYYFGENCEEAIETATAMTDDRVYIYKQSTVKFSVLLWYLRPDPYDYVENAVYVNADGWQDLIEYGKYHYIETPDALETGQPCIIQKHQIWDFVDYDCEVLQLNEEYYIIRLQE